MATEAKVEEMLQELTNKFEEADVDKNGSLTFDEVYRLMCDMGFFTPQDKEAASMAFDKMDVDGDKRITKGEFEFVTKNLSNYQIRGAFYRRMMQTRDLSQFVKRSKLEEAIKELGGHVDPEIIKKVEKPDDPEMVDYETFIHEITKNDIHGKLKSVFLSLDKDKNGRLNRSDIINGFFLEPSLRLERQRIRILLDKVVRDNDHQLDWGEFLEAWLLEPKQ